MKGAIAIGLIGFLALAGCSRIPGTEANRQRKAYFALAHLIAEPQSMIVRDVREGAGFLCGELNGKNQFDQYAGFTRFIARADATLVELEPLPIKVETADSRAEHDTFEQLWASCRVG